MPAHLSNEEFFSSLSSLLSSTSQKSRGSVFLTQKPLPVSPAPAAAADAADASQEESSQQRPPKPAILIRATDGNTNAPNPKTTTKKNSKSTTTTNNNNNNKKMKGTTDTPKVKLSTIVAPEDLEAFYARYAEVCKAGMSGLKKRDRKKGKAKAKGAQAKVVKP
ncbi:hypothetical protein VTN02DRAFT_2547 [Thermoascus thermophilus]